MYKLKYWWLDLPRDVRKAFYGTGVFAITIVILVLGNFNGWLWFPVVVWGFATTAVAINGAWDLGMRRDALYVFEMEKKDPQAVLNGIMMKRAIELLSPDTMENTSNTLRVAAKQLQVTQMPDGEKHAHLLLALERFLLEILEGNQKAIKAGATREIWEQAVKNVDKSQ